MIQAAEPADKAKVYKELGLELTYEPGKQIVRAQVILGPDIRGVIGSVRGPTQTLGTCPNDPFAGSIPLDAPFPNPASGTFRS